MMNDGKVSENILKLSILNQLHTKNEEVICGAGIGTDCALFSLSDDKILAACAAEAAVAIQADIGSSDTLRFTMAQLIKKCVNNLAVNGATPVSAIITLLLPADTENSDIRLLMSQADEACREFSMQIAGGQSRILKEIKVPIAVVNGYGEAPKDGYRTVKMAKPGQDIVLSKWAGLEGTAILAGREENKLNEHYPAYLAETSRNFTGYFSIVPEAEVAVKNGVSAMHDASEGGIFAALWELAEGAGVGLDIDIKKIPLRQETVEVCECLGVNPYELMSGGCLVMTADDGEALVRALEAENIPAAIVGRTTPEKSRIIRNDDEVRYMDRPKQDGIYEIYNKRKGMDQSRTVR